ncbi:transmembrane protein, putative (macronuclear) [Tetrahymena thermophila SB210]|uniref:Transmembrane protein, putative n=1 Tax=Tetrahymena thermophila (strain SB210) TaxID=312017 RepID=A4VEP4_TETTS|nr:transmembrane protein, putative [Tetrahymena thermophila SB210]EDK32003.1 transmembrane protein, putative [Tetrahymena thermophila SB210]|eukprot:XP_001471138.1 transmembrane protein, putative [Tetrahymena thermophila SB210]
MRLLAASIFFILAITNVSAIITHQEFQQCQATYENSAQTLCLRGDQDCFTALQNIGNCLDSCASDTKKSYNQILNCAKTNCTTSNQNVQSWLNKYLSCLYLGKLSLSFLLLALFVIVF